MRARGAVPPWALAVTAMLSVQLSSALAVGLVDTVGPAGTAWLRLSMGAAVFLLLARPPLRDVRRGDVPALLGLGVTTGLVTVLFLAAIERIPLGTAVAIEFLGPLTVAALRSRGARALGWPALALLGVLLLTEPWRGALDAAGIAFAAGAALGWAVYITLTQRVGDRFSGIGALSMTVPIAALTAAVAGVPEAAGSITPGVLLTAAGLALLLPVLSFTLELLALRRMTPTAFGTLMALEPAFGVLLGLVVLGQDPAAPQVLGVLLVVLAGAAAQRDGRRPSAGAPAGAPAAAGAIGREARPPHRARVRRPRRPHERVRMTCSSTFIFEIAALDDEFHRLNDEIAERARALPGFLGEESWHNEATGLHAEVYYWTDMEALQALVGMDTHGVAKGRHGEWLGEYRVVISEVRATYGNPALGLEHVPPTPPAAGT